MFMAGTKKGMRAKHETTQNRKTENTVAIPSVVYKRAMNTNNIRGKEGMPNQETTCSPEYFFKSAFI